MCADRERNDLKKSNEHRRAPCGVSPLEKGTGICYNVPDSTEKERERHGIYGDPKGRAGPPRQI